MKEAKTLNILNLEDDPLDTELVQSTLVEGGINCHVIRVQTRTDFVAALEDGGFDLVLSDYVLPSFDGRSALELALRLRPEVPFIIISGTLGEERAIDIMKSGATDYVLKHRLERLVPAVQRAIREAEERKEREEAEEALKESERRFRHLVEQAADAMFVYDLEGRFVDVNRQACESLGYTREELLAMSVPDVEIGYAREGLHELWTRTGSGEYRTLERIHRRKDGTTFPVEVRIGIFESEGRRLMLALARDVTERKRADEDLRLRDRAIAASTSGIVVTDCGQYDNPIVYVNPAFEHITGYGAEESLGRNCRFLQGEDRDQPAIGELRAALREERPCTVTLKNYKKDGTLFWNELSISPVRDEEGRLTHFVGAQNEVTERKRAEEELNRLASYPTLDPNPIVETNVAGELTYLNPAAVARFPDLPNLKGRHPLLVGLEQVEREIREDGVGSVTREVRVGDTFYQQSISPVPEGNRLRLYAVETTERRQAEEALKESEERFRSLVQNASDIVMILDADGTIRYESPAAERVLGFRPEERIGFDSFDAMHPDDVGPVKSRIAELLEKPGERLSINYRILNKWGSWIHFEALSTNLVDDPVIRGIVVNSRDVTERERAERALKESEERFRTLAEEALEGIVLSENGLIFDANASALRTFGYELDEVVGKAAVHFVAPEDRNVITQKLSSGSTEPYEVQGLKKDGTVFPVELRPRHVPYRGRQVRLTSFVDLTERRKAEEALRQSEKLYRTVIEQAAENIFLVDVETKRLLETNAALQRSLGYTAEELKRMTLYDFVAHDRESIDRNTQRTLERGRHFVGERMYQRKDGSLVDVEVNVSIVTYEGREVMCVVAHDVTERKRAEENLRQSLSVLLALREAGQILGSTLESEEIVSRLLEIMQRVSHLTAAVIGVRDETGQTHIWRSVGVERLWPQARFAPQAEEARLMALEGDEERTFSLRREAAGPEPGQHLVGLCLPLRTRDRVIGVLEAYGPELLAESDTTEIISSLASQAASALENAQLYGEVAKREHRLQDLIGRLLGAQEEERRRVAYEVHDGLAQVAVAAHQHLQAYSRRHPPETERSQRDLERVLRLVRQTVSDARKIIANLRPTALDDFGLAAAVSLEIERLREEGYRVDYEEGLGEERLPSTAEITLFRVAQEALTNMRKHAATQRVYVELRREGDEARLEVRDYGRGFDPTTASAGGNGPGERIGLAGMRERIGMLGGRLEIHSQPGTGTAVIATISLGDTATEQQGEE